MKAKEETTVRKTEKKERPFLIRNRSRWAALPEVRGSRGWEPSATYSWQVGTQAPGSAQPGQGGQRLGSFLLFLPKMGGSKKVQQLINELITMGKLSWAKYRNSMSAMLKSSGKHLFFFKSWLVFHGSEQEKLKYTAFNVTSTCILTVFSTSQNYPQVHLQVQTWELLGVFLKRCLMRRSLPYRGKNII